MDIVVRVALIYVCVVAGLRVLGNRDFGELSPVELVTLLLIPEIVSPALIGEGSLTGAVIGVSTLLTLVFIVSLLRYVSKRVERAFEGKSSVLVAHGQLLLDCMHQEHVDSEEIFSAMHSAGLESLDQVRWAILESDGTIAIVPQAGAQGSLPFSQMAQKERAQL